MSPRLRHVGPSSLSQGLNPGPLHWEYGVLATGLPGRSQWGHVDGKFILWKYLYLAQIWKILVSVLSHSVVSDFLWPLGCSPPGSSVHGIFQARILEWGRPFLLQGNPLDPGVKTQSPGSPALQTWFFTLWAIRKWGLVSSCAGSVVAACMGLVAPRHVGILVPWLGVEPVFPALVGRFLTTGPPGKPLLDLYFWFSRSGVGPVVLH